MFSNSVISKFKSAQTPFYYYDISLLQDTLKEIQKHGVSKGYHIHYAIKANFNPGILKYIREADLGIDCVSGNEIERAVNEGFSPSKIAFAGVGKTDQEIQTGLDHDIFSFNCESLQELTVLNNLAEKSGKIAPITIRLNPNVEAKTHKYITTGLNENKFGITANKLPTLFDLLPKLGSVSLQGIHFHIGSQIRNFKPFKDLCHKVNDLQKLFEEKGYSLEHINLGGGLGINYDNPEEEPIPDFETFFNLFDEHLIIRNNQEVHFELGRSIVGQCGSLISSILFIKEGITTNFAVIDAGMTELIRPALYQARHHIEPLTSNKPSKKYDVVGPICETSDTFQKGLQLPELQRGDIIAIRSTGAYGEVMSSHFNLREKVPTLFSTEFDS